MEDHFYGGLLVFVEMAKQIYLWWRLEDLIHVILKKASDIDKYEHDHLIRGLRTSDEHYI
jgi:hypothetical protein